ncbi:MAG: asparagine synthetase B, partial [Candidatus Parabeggiatoa sp. nov. 2]
MCGITGIIRQDASISLDKYYQAHLTIKHRGPDDEGFVIKTRAGKMVPCRGKDTISELQNLPDIRSQSSTKMVLGHRRLSILDRTYQGHQPFYFEGLWLIYNGEVYNYIEIRGELQNQGYRFETKTDTEVVIKAYHCWGTDAFSKFNGMWGMAIYEEANDRLILSRDRFGIKPLYYCLNNTEFLFASEVKF